ncbi:hypothetical protein BST81_11155 [Leptolyngbya sp. 'hensonii']|nr:hypothetical protein BST81_11155 [Leptolyngbya sp. 'hensonii']
MTQVLDSLSLLECSDPILCCYVNGSCQMQIARIADVPNWYFERVVFPGQRLLFEAPSLAHLEIHTSLTATSILTDHISCQTLKVEEK